MKLTITFPELDAQRRQMGASLSVWDSQAQPLDARAELLRDLSDGIEIEIGDIVRGPGGLLTYQGEQIVLHIKDTRDSRWTLENQPEKSRRFHIAECDTLQKMRQAGRFERYVASNGTTGMFKVDWLDDETGKVGETQSALKVCRNCLKEVNYRGYQSPNGRLMLPEKQRQTKGQIWENFSMSEFLLDFATLFSSKPSRTADNAEIDRYVPEWAEISEKRRREENWTCENCNVFLGASPNLLHAHHRSGVKTDNSRSNLKVLCGLCHSEQPMHEHMKFPHHDRAKIVSLRTLQKA